MSDTKSKVWEFVKRTGSGCMNVYLDYAVPLSIFMVFSLCIDMQTRDPEKYGVLWLNYADTEAAERTSRFPLPKLPGTASVAAAAPKELELDALQDD